MHLVAIVIEFSKPNLTIVSKKNESVRATVMSRALGVGFKVAIAVTLILAVALIVGLLLDELLNMERQLFTFGMVMLSIPITLWTLWKISMSAVADIPTRDEANSTAKTWEDKTTE